MEPSKIAALDNGRQHANHMLRVDSVVANSTFNGEMIRHHGAIVMAPQSAGMMSWA